MSAYGTLIAKVSPSLKCWVGSDGSTIPFCSFSPHLPEVAGLMGLAARGYGQEVPRPCPIISKNIYLVIE